MRLPGRGISSHVGLVSDTGAGMNGHRWNGSAAGEQPHGNGDWPDPIPITTTLPPVEPYVSGMLPDVLRAYVEDVADRQQAPVDFAAVACVCGAAAVLGNKVRIRPKQHDDWQVTPNQWGALIGPPSAMKTPAMQSALGAVYALQDEMRDRWKEECKTAALDDALAGLDAKEAKKQAQKCVRRATATKPSGSSPRYTRTRRTSRRARGSSSTTPRSRSSASC